jgi:hypothetical protein
MRNPLLFIVVVFLSISAYGQAPRQHYIKFLHVGEKIQPVNTINISYQDVTIPRDSIEQAIDSLPVKSIVTDRESYNAVRSYIKKATFKMGRSPGQLYFGTFKITDEGKYFYLPGNSVTAYFKNMVLYLKKKKSDPQLIHTIIDNYPWIFNP